MIKVLTSPVLFPVPAVSWHFPIDVGVVVCTPTVPTLLAPLGWVKALRLEELLLAGGKRELVPAIGTYDSFVLELFLLFLFLLRHVMNPLLFPEF